MRYKTNAREVSALLMLAGGLVLAFISLYMPPRGVIDSSVIYIFAQVLIYAGSALGIDYYIRQKFDGLGR